MKILDCEPTVREGGEPARRLELDPERAEKGLAELVLTIIELLRQVVERQALRRVERGDLSPEKVERLGLALMRLEKKMEELKRHFEIDSLELDLGPLGRIVDPHPRGEEESGNGQHRP